MTIPGTPQPQEVPGYGYARPQARDLYATLERVFGRREASALWRTACRDAGLDPAAGDAFDLDALEALTARFLAMQGPERTVGISFEMRLRTWYRLAEGRAAIERFRRRSA